MNRRAILLLTLVCWWAALPALPCQAADMQITPFRTVNQSPLVQIFGLPQDTTPLVTPRGGTTVSLTQDVASNYTFSATAREQIILDGESYRWTLAARYGLTRRSEVGLELPYIVYGGGFLDSFIVDWHRTFNLPQGGRDQAPKDRLNFSYVRDGVQRLKKGRSSSGIGDITLTGALQLLDNDSGTARDLLALRTSLKLPTGKSADLAGSGSTDLTLSLCGSMNNFTEWGSLGVFGSLGGMAMTRGDVLSDQQNRLAGFASAGLGWGPASWISFKVQLNAHTPLYHGSDLNELSKASLMLVTGGALKLPGNYLLDLGVSEDVAVAAAPDVAFHLGLSKRF